MPLIIITVSIYIAYDIHRIQWVTQQESLTDNWGEQQKGDIYSFIRNKTEDDAIIASANAWLAYLNTNRPSIMLPDTIDQQKIYKKFVNKYHVSFIILEREIKIDGTKVYSSKQGSIYEIY